VQRTVSGLLKLISPDQNAEISDENVAWAVRLALEVRRRVKEQQKRVGSAEFRNTHFSFQLGEDGVEQFVTTAELQSDDTISSDPLPPGQVWALGVGGPEEHAGLYRVDVNMGPGSGVKVMNNPVPKAFQERVRYAEQNLYAQARSLVGEREPRQHEFSLQLRAFDAARSGAGLGLPALLALCSALLEKSLRGGLIAVGNLNLGGGIDPVYNAVDLAELAAEKRATTLLIPISARRQLNDLSDDVAARLTLLYYTAVRDALLKALGEP